MSAPYLSRKASPPGLPSEVGSTHLTSMATSGTITAPVTVGGLTTMSRETRVAVRQVLEIVPLVTRTLAPEARQPGHTLPPVHFGLLLILTHRAHNLSELAEKPAVGLPTMSNSIFTLVERGVGQPCTSLPRLPRGAHRVDV